LLFCFRLLLVVIAFLVIFLIIITGNLFFIFVVFCIILGVSTWIIFIIFCVVFKKVTLYKSRRTWGVTLFVVVTFLFEFIVLYSVVIIIFIAGIVFITCAFIAGTKVEYMNEWLEHGEVSSILADKIYAKTCAHLLVVVVPLFVSVFIAEFDLGFFLIVVLIIFILVGRNGFITERSTTFRVIDSSKGVIFDA
jgi:hypothetical protein